MEVLVPGTGRPVVGGWSIADGGWTKNHGLRDYVVAFTTHFLVHSRSLTGLVLVFLGYPFLWARFGPTIVHSLAFFFD